MAICNSHKIRQVNIVFIINTVDSVLLNYTAISHIFLEYHLFSLYHPLTNDKYIMVGGHYYVSVASIGSITLIMILSNDILKLTFTDILYILILGADLISFGVLYYLVQS